MRGKRQKVVITAILSIWVIAVIALITIKGIGTNAAATNEADKIVVPVSNPNYEVGTAENPFVLLEIVPYEGYAEIGYLIAGEEPVDMEVLSWSNTYNGLIQSTKSFNTEPSLYVRTFDPPEAMLKANEYGTETAIQYGYFKKIEDHSGDYNQIVTRQNGDRIESANYVLAQPAGTGDYLWIGMEYGKQHNKSTDHNADEVYTFINQTLYNANHVEYTNKNIFLKECLGLSDEDIASYHIKVITVTSTQLNQEQNLGLIDRANLIYITDKSHNGSGFLAVWQDDRFRRTDKFKYYETLGEEPKVRFTDPQRDLSWEAVIKILRKKSGCGLGDNVTIAPLIYDVNSLTSEITLTSVEIKKITKDGRTVTSNASGSENNVYKLGLMIRQMDTADIFKLYIDKGLIVSTTRSDGMSTGKFVSLNGNAATYWAAMTLIPFHLVNYNDNYAIMKQDLIAAGYSRYDGFSDNTFAGDSLYMFNADNSLGMTFEQKSVSYTDQTKEAFDYFGITKEDANNPVSPILLTPAQVVQYLLNNSRIGSDLPSLTILEIQPFDKYKTDWSSFIKYLFPSFRGTLIVKTMTSKEFNCHTEDLNGTYDLIYIGVKKESITSNQALDLSTSYFTYSHVGNTAYVENYEGHLVDWIPGVAYTNFTTRFSGNDITALKKEELKGYASAGYPILFGDGVLASDNSSINTSIDRSSNVYELLTSLKVLGKVMYEKTVISQKVERDKLRALIYGSFFDVTFEQLPVAYQDISTGVSEADAYINGKDNDKRNLDIIFKIDDKSIGNKYKVSVYLDINGDGVFYEAVGYKNEQVFIQNVVNLGTGNSVDSANLQSGVRYHISKDISQYSGVIPWKIVIERLDNLGSASGIKVVQTGISAIKKSALENKIELKVLQIASDKPVVDTIGSSKPSVYLPTTAEIVSSGAISLTSKQDVIRAFQGLVKDEKNARVPDELAKTTALFYYYTRNLKDYEITFDRLSVSQFITKFQAGQINLDSYNMLIIGFADICTDITYPPALTAINNFISEGKAVLFTHDTSLYSSQHNITQKFRNTLGMDRFGTTLLKQGTVNISSTTAVQQLKGYGKDIMYTPNTLQASNSAELFRSYGFTNLSMRWFAGNNSEKVSFHDLTTTKVTNINQGQITQYPYLIGEEIEVATTHVQYYQLDMENPNIVVWYSLEDDEVDDNDNVDDSHYYEKNDGQNGYYIYSNGNITYSGAGHILSSTGPGMPDLEIKLFVNTIIAAYRATPKASEVEILNSDKTTDKNNKDYLMINYDTSNAEIAVGYDIDTDSQTKRIYYRLKDNSIVNSSMQLEVKYYSVDTTKTPPENELILDTKLKSDGSIVANNAVSVGTEYYVDVSLDDLRKTNSYDIAIEVTLTYMAEREVTLTSTKYVQLLRRGLFNID